MQEYTWEVGEFFPILQDTHLLMIGQCFHREAPFVGFKPIISIDTGGLPQVAECLTIEQFEMPSRGSVESFRIFEIGKYDFRILCEDRSSLLISTFSGQCYLIKKKNNSHLVITSMQIHEDDSVPVPSERATKI